MEDSLIDQLQQEPSTDVLANIFIAAEDAYKALAAEKGYNPDEVHRLGVCHQAASHMVNSLLANGHKVEHEIRGGWNVLEHSYVTLDPGDGEEIVIDPTWQQFLPKDKIAERAPKVLVGTRHSVIEQARRYGADEFTLHLWEPGPSKTPAEQRAVDDEAERASEEAWEKLSIAS